MSGSSARRTERKASTPHPPDEVVMVSNKRCPYETAFSMLMPPLRRLYSFYVQVVIAADHADVREADFFKDRLVV